MRYGLQHLNPNVQNYLIEFKGSPPKPTGRIIIRDLQDASLQREVIWALYGLDRTPPSLKTDLKDLRLPVLAYEFSPAVIDDSQETGTTNSQFGPPGMHFLWARFSMFGGNRKSPEFVERMLNEGNPETFEKIASTDFAELMILQSPIRAWPASEFEKYSDYTDLTDDEDRRKVLRYAANYDNAAELKRHFPNMIQSRRFKSIVDAIIDKAGKNVEAKRQDVTTKTIKLLLSVMAEWGLSHNLAYVHTCEKAMGVNFGIDWRTVPKPSRHLLDKDIDYSSEREWEEATANSIQNYIASTEGQRKIREYKTRNWKPAKPVFRLQLLDKDSRPMEEEPLKIVQNSGGKKWVDMTDREGYVYVYEGDPKDYQFEIISVAELAGGLFSVNDLKEKASGPYLDFGYMKIQYAAG
jgi:hypothetical protein